jgi:NAD(P)-dependent dehydrogenase (short-subunit alcohol dehydrogenase family)
LHVPITGIYSLLFCPASDGPWRTRLAGSRLLSWTREHLLATTGSRSKTVLITGGSQGIGAAAVCRFFDEGWRVSTVALPGERVGRWSKKEVLTLEGDITSPQVRRKIVDATLTRFGTIDALVNNAGVGLYESPSNLPLDLFQRLFEVNVLAPLALAQLVIPVMRRQGKGTIINVGSVAGHVSMPWASGYCASKFALHSLSDSLRRELGREGIRVVKICPGIVATRFRSNVLAGEAPGEVTAVRPVVPPEQVANAIFRAAQSPSRHTIFIPELARWFSLAQYVCPSLLDWYLQRFPARHERTQPVEQPVAKCVESGVEP